MADGNTSDGHQAERDAIEQALFPDLSRVSSQPSSPSQVTETLLSAARGSARWEEAGGKHAALPALQSVFVRRHDQGNTKPMPLKRQKVNCCFLKYLSQ